MVKTETPEILALRATEKQLLDERAIVVKQIDAADEAMKATPEYQALQTRIEAIFLQIYGYQKKHEYGFRSEQKKDPDSVYQQIEATEKAIYSLFTTDGKYGYLRRYDQYSGKKETNIRDDVFETIKTFGPVSKLKAGQIEEMVYEWVGYVTSNSAALKALKAQQQSLDKEQNKLEEEQNALVYNNPATASLRESFQTLTQKIKKTQRALDDSVSEARRGPLEEARSTLVGKSEDIFNTIMAQRKADGEV